MQAVLSRRVLITRSYEQLSHCPDIGNMRWQVGQMAATLRRPRFASPPADVRCNLRPAPPPLPPLPLPLLPPPSSLLSIFLSLSASDRDPL